VTSRPRSPLRLGPWTALPALAIALVWAYEGGWCKALGQCGNQTDIVASVPGLPAGLVRTCLVLLGLAELAVGGWVLSGRRPWLAAQVQTTAVVAFNTGGLVLASSSIQEPGRLVVTDLALIALIWLVARDVGACEASRGD